MHTIAMASSTWSIELHISNFKKPFMIHCRRPFIEFASMASKGTPKKYQSIPGLKAKVISRCRLCNSVGDPEHSKNLFRDSNRILLRNAETVYGDKLPQSSDLPHLICRPCERRLNTAIQFRRTISETQRLLRQDVRTKRCVELSPSVAKPAPKLQETESPRRRSLDFNIASGNQNENSNALLHVSIFYPCVLVEYTALLMSHLRI
jgi:hypothetical protein